MLCYEDLYKLFGCNLNDNKGLIHNSAEFKILEMAPSLMPCQALIHLGIPRARTLDYTRNTQYARECLAAYSSVIGEGNLKGNISEANGLC